MQTLKDLPKFIRRYATNTGWQRSNPFDSTCQFY
jgi:hypothetical protein